MLMPAIFDNGMWTCGRGAIAWGRGKTVLGRLEKAGPACVLDQQHVVCQALHKGRWQVVALDVAGGEVHIVSTRGATELMAQGGKWARLLGNDMTIGTLLGETRTYPNAAPVDVAIDGRIGYKPRHQPDGVGLGIIRPDGSTVRISDTVARDVAVVPGRDAAVWARSEGLGAAGITVVSVPRPTSKPRVLIIDGRPWLLYQFSFPNTGGKGGRLVLHPFDSLDGYVVSESRTNLQAHRPAAVRLSDGSLLIPYCRTEGESVESLELETVRLADRRVDVSDFAVPGPTPTPSPSPIPAPQPPTMPAPSKRLEVVQQARNRYDAMPPGARRAYFIMNAVAWALQDDGAGLFAKTSGANYNGYSLDVLIYRTGHAIDVLGDPENKANPQWSYTGPEGESGRADVSKWRPAEDPTTLEGGQPQPAPQGGLLDTAALRSALLEIRTEVDALLSKLG
jgi:hypothetical protein